MPRRCPPPDAPARFEFVEDDHGGVTVMRDGHPQSHVTPHDPQVLEFEYMQHMALVLDSVRPSPPARLTVTHVGGAGLALPRYVEATRPGSPQIVLEPDEELTGAVRAALPLPRGHRIRVRGVEGREGMAALKDAAADVVIVDAFAGGRVPASLVTPSFIADVFRVLSPDGVAMFNLADEPGLTWARRAMATVSARACHLVVVAAQEVLKGRRFGNLVVAAALSPEAIDAGEIARRAARAVFPVGVRHGERLTRLQHGARAFTDADALPSPVPPELGTWRVR